MFIAFISSVIGLLRILGLKSLVYQAVAHLWCGGLAVAAFKERNVEKWLILIGISILEVVCAVHGTFKVLQ